MTFGMMLSLGKRVFSKTPGWVFPFFLGGLIILGIGYFLKHDQLAGNVDAVEPRGVTSIRAGIPSASLLDQAMEALKPETAGSGGPTAKVLGMIDAPNVSVSQAKVSTEKLRVLDEILSTMNDNDPRLDQILRNFTAEEKLKLRAKYFELEPELLNQRGTLVFLAGRELTNVQDLKFMAEVLSEEPCRSLGNCAEEQKGAEIGSAHGDIGTDTTLIYSQLVVLHSYENELRKPDLPADMKESIRHSLEDSRRSRHPRIASRATQILQEFGQ
jgi:hypothetical protein